MLECLSGVLLELKCTKGQSEITLSKKKCKLYQLKNCIKLGKFSILANTVCSKKLSLNFRGQKLIIKSNYFCDNQVIESLVISNPK